MQGVYAVMKQVRKLQTDTPYVFTMRLRMVMRTTCIISKLFATVQYQSHDSTFTLCFFRLSPPFLPDRIDSIGHHDYFLQLFLLSI